MRGLRRSSFCFLRVLVLVSIVTVTLPGCAGKPATPMPMVEPPEVQQRSALRTQMYQDGIGSRVMLIGDTSPVPYLPSACFSLANDWYSNQLPANELPDDLAARLGLAGDAPPLQVFYFLGDELFLRTGPEVVDQFQPGQRRRVCLNHPGQSALGDCSPLAGLSNGTASDSVLALEFDLYMDPGSAARLQPIDGHRRTSGTVIVATKITIAGVVQTEGYNLALVADDVEFVPGGTIDTTPPTRPRGATRAYDYGAGRPGYNAGNVVIAARNVIGPARVVAQGGIGQQGADNWDSTNLQELVAGIETVTSEFYPLYRKIDGGLYDLIKEEHLTRWTVATNYVLLDVGERGRGGVGGHGGQVTFVAGPGACSKVNKSVGGAAGGPGGTTLYSLPCSCPSLHQSHTDSETVVAGATTCAGQRCICFEDNTGYSCNSCDRRTCDTVHCQLDNISSEVEAGACLQSACPKLTCTPSCFDAAADVLADYMRAGTIPPTNLCRDNITNRVARWQVDGFLAPIAPGGRQLTLRGKTGLPGDQGRLEILTVAGTENLEPLEEAGGTANPSSIKTVPACQAGTSIGEQELTATMLALAPLYPDLLLAKADVLVRSLADSDLANGDRPFSQDAQRNPFGLNRILLAQHLLDSVQWICAGLPGNPQPAYCAVAAARKAALRKGLNWLGLPPQLYLPRDPSRVQPFAAELLSLYRDQRALFRDAVAAWDESVNQREAVQAQLDLLGVAAQRAQFAKEELLAEAQAAAADLQITFERITALQNAIAATQGPDPAPECPSCSYESPCTVPSVSIEVGILQACTRPPECNVRCWVGRVFDVVKLTVGVVASIYTLHLGTGLATLDNAFKMLGTGDDLWSKIATVARYADLATSGKPDGVTWDVDGTAYSLPTDDSFKKDVVDPVAGGIEAVKSLQSTYAQVFPGDNPVRGYLGQIRDNTARTLSEMQRNLTNVYQIEAEIDDSTGLAHARSLEDLIKSNMARQNEAEEARRQNLLATTRMSLVSARLKLTSAEQAYLGSVLQRWNRRRSALENTITDHQIAVDGACMAADEMERRYHYVSYLHARSVDFLYLSPPGDYDLSRVGLIDADFSTYNVDSADGLIGTFIDNVLKPQQNAGVVQAWIVPADWKWVGGTSFVSRTPAERAQAVCGSAGRPCKLTQVAYWDRVVQDLKQDGVATYELVPRDDPAFLSLPETDRNQWNVGLMLVEQAARTRVVDVGVRVILEDFTPPDSHVVPRVTVRHDDWSILRPALGQDYEVFLFDSDLARNACAQLAAIVKDRHIDCTGEWGFVQRFESADETVNSVYAHFANLSPEVLKGNPMFGASVHGKWTIDLSEWLAQLRNFSGVNACPRGPRPCTPEEAFWRAFRGIQFVVYYERAVP